MTKLLRPKWIILALVGVYLSVMGVVTLLDSPQANVQPVQATEAIEAVQDTPLDSLEIHRLVNNERVKRGLGKLTLDERLIASAEWKCNDMTEKKYYGHYDPKTKDTSMDYLVRHYGEADYSENLNESVSPERNKFSTNESMVNSWLESESHRDAMLDGKYTHTGVATCIADGKKTVVQHFSD